IGMLLGLLGGSLAFGWERRESPRARQRALPPPPKQSSAGLALILGDDASERGDEATTERGTGLEARPEPPCRDVSQRYPPYRLAATAAVSAALSVLSGPLPSGAPPRGASPPVASRPAARP